MSDRQSAIQALLDHEGGQFVADDHGRGPSRFGITLRTAREFYPNCTAPDIALCTREVAAEFYQRFFWQRYGIFRLSDQSIACKMLDLCVNIGPGTAIKLLQRVVKETADGVLGPHTAAAANAMASDVLLAGLRAAGKAHYDAILRAHPEWSNCYSGWIARLES